MIIHNLPPKILGSLLICAAQSYQGDTKRIKIEPLIDWSDLITRDSNLLEFPHNNRKSNPKKQNLRRG
ncbi:MAG: hypothetical protein CMM76_08950 [Rhodospirillaceae bacterium]|nr:hypothetical protein [Rhodospirillaceae bacterium]